MASEALPAMTTEEAKLLYERLDVMDEKSVLRICKDMNVDITRKSWKNDLIQAIIDERDDSSSRSSSEDETGDIAVREHISGYESTKALPTTETRTKRAERYQLMLKADLIAQCEQLDIQISRESGRDGMIEAILDAEDEALDEESEVTGFESRHPLPDLMMETAAEREKRYKASKRSDLYGHCQRLGIVTSGGEPDSQLIRSILDEEDRRDNVAKSRVVNRSPSTPKTIKLSPPGSSPSNSMNVVPPFTPDRPIIVPPEPPRISKSKRKFPIHSTNNLHLVSPDRPTIGHLTPPNTVRRKHRVPIQNRPSAWNTLPSTITPQSIPVTSNPVDQPRTIQRPKLQTHQQVRPLQWLGSHPHKDHPGITVHYPSYATLDGRRPKPVEVWYAPLYRTPRMNVAAEKYNNMPGRHIEAIIKARAYRGVDQLAESKLAQIEVLLLDDLKMGRLPWAPKPNYPLPPGKLAASNPDKEMFDHTPTVMQVAVLKSLEGPEQDAARFQFAREEFYEDFLHNELKPEVIARRVPRRANTRRALVNSDMQLFERMNRRRKGPMPRAKRVQPTPVAQTSTSKAPKVTRRKNVPSSPATIYFGTKKPTLMAGNSGVVMGKPKKKQNIGPNSSTALTTILEEPLEPLAEGDKTQPGTQKNHNIASNSSRGTTQSSKRPLDTSVEGEEHQLKRQRSAISWLNPFSLF